MQRPVLDATSRITYQYDAAGNRTATGGSFARTLVPTAIGSSTYDAGNQQLAFGSLTQTFDANGNLVTQTDPVGTTTYTWDARNRLTGISGPTVTASFAYDALGRQVARTINGSTTTYLYDGLDVVGESSAGSSATYVRTLSIDEALTRTAGGSTTAYLADVLGSTVALADGSGVPVTTYTFEPFGRTEVTGAPSANPFRFTGREDDGTGLYYYRARYYDPVRSRFIREDPIGMAGGMNVYAYVDSVGKLVEANLYTYARNSPTNFLDPSGESALGIGLKVLRSLLGLGVYGWMTGVMGGRPTNEAELKDTDGDGVPDYQDPEPINPNEPVPGAGGMCPVQPAVPFTPKRYPPVRPY